LFFHSPQRWGLFHCGQTEMKKTIVLALLAHHLWVADLAQAATDEAPVFDVYEYVIEGNTVLPAQVVERTVAPFMGPGKSFKDIELARAALEKAYQDSGYLTVLVSLPNQQVNQGEVRLEVQESSVEKLKISGSQYHLPSKLRAQVPSLAKGQVPEFGQVQKELAEAQTADLQVTPLIAASESGEGIDVDLKVQDTLPLHGSIEWTNGQSYNTSRGRLSASATYANLFQRGHSIGLSWQYAPYRPKDGNTLSLIYGLPLSSRDDLLASLTNSNSDTPTNTGSGGPTATLTKGEFFGLRWTRRLNPGNWPVRHNFFAAFDYKNNRDANTFEDGATTTKPPLRYPLFTGGYSLTWTTPDAAVTSVNTTLKGSVDKLAGRNVNCGGIELDQFACKRAGSSADFLAWQVGLAHSRQLWKGWQLNLSADAQFASGPLPGGEQYSLGGPSTVRGYFDYEQSGDEGWTSRIELVSPAWLRAGSWQASSLVFADRGFVHYMNPQSTQLGRIHLGSQGLGLRVASGEGFQLSLDVARPVFDTQRVTDSGTRAFASGPKAKRGVRVDLSVRQSF
jgi:hemolysin activation/secretion protein